MIPMGVLYPTRGGANVGGSRLARRRDPLTVRDRRGRCTDRSPVNLRGWAMSAVPRVRNGARWSRVDLIKHPD